MIKLILVINSLRVGGAERIAAMLANHVHVDVNLNAAVEIITLDSNVSFYNLSPEIKVTCIPGSRFAVGVVRLPIMAWQGAWLAIHLRAIRRAGSKIRLVSFLHRANIVAVIAAVLSKVGVTVSERSLFASSYSGIKKAAMGAILRRAYRVPDSIIAISSAVKRELVDLLGVDPRRVRIISNPSFAGHHSRHSSPRLVRRLLYVGRLVPSKSVEFLLRGLSLLVEGDRTYKLTIVGQGASRASLDMAVRRMGLEANVDFRGAVEDVIPFYDQSHVFVYASQYESFGNVLVEATSRGLPCVVNRVVDGRVDIFPDKNSGAVLYEDGNLEQYVAAVRLVSDESKWTEVSRDASRNAAKFDRKTAMMAYIYEIFDMGARA